MLEGDTPRFARSILCSASQSLNGVGLERLRVVVAKQCKIYRDFSPPVIQRGVAKGRGSTSIGLKTPPRLRRWSCTTVLANSTTRAWCYAATAR